MSSLDSLDYSSEQEVFNYVANHLLNQNKQAKAIHNHEDICAYRAEEGTLKCAAGCLISNEDYSPEMENKNINAVLQTHKGESLKKLAGKIDLLTSLQSIHDRHKPHAWRTELISLGQRRGFDVTSIQSA